jgi:hypothetical protein
MPTREEMLFAHHEVGDLELEVDLGDSCCESGRVATHEPGGDGEIHGIDQVGCRKGAVELGAPLGVNETSIGNEFPELTH